MKNINTKTKIIIVISILTLFVGFFYKNFTSDKSREIFEKEKISLETQIADERKIRAEKKEIQEKLYAEWQKADKELEVSINEKKERLEAIKTLLGEKSGGIIPTASASEIAPKNPEISEIPETPKISKNLHEKVCEKQPNSPICKDKELFDRLQKITEERTNKPYMFAMLLGITNSESSLGTNYAPHAGCANYNNFGGIKWRKTDDGQSVRDQPIPQADGCWLYKFESYEDYWISKVNSIRYGYAGCLLDNPTVALQCISKWYVRGDGKIIKHGWVKNASIFLN